MTEYKIVYYIIYLFAALFSIFFAVYIDFKKKNYKGIARYISITLMFAFILLFGLRNIDIGTDTEMYHWQYTHYDEIVYGTDALIGIVFKFLNFFSENPQSFLFLMSFLFVSINIYVLKKHSDFYNSNFALSVFSLISLFFFESLGINVIRQGLSLAFFSLAIIIHNYSPLKRFKWMLFIILSVCFHLTSAIPIALYFLVTYLKKINIRYYYFLYLISVIASSAGISILYFKEYFIGLILIDERRSNYFLNGTEFDYSVGFKPQFVIFNTVFLIIFIYLNKIQKSAFYINLLKYYIVISSLFFFMFQIPYSDRWGVMSWSIIPLLLVPMFKVYQNKISIRATFSILFLIFVFIFFQFR